MKLDWNNSKIQKARKYVKNLDWFIFEVEHFDSLIEQKNLDLYYAIEDDVFEEILEFWIQGNEDCTFCGVDENICRYYQYFRKEKWDFYQVFFYGFSFTYINPKEFIKKYVINGDL